MHEPAPTREEELAARAAEAGLTLVGVYPAGNTYLLLDAPVFRSVYESCADLDAVEKAIETREGGNAA